MHTKLKAFVLAALLAGTTGLTGTATENVFLVIRAANYK